MFVINKYYLQTHLEECKYEIKKTKMENLINDELESSPLDDKIESDNEPDIESYNELDDETNNESDNE